MTSSSVVEVDARLLTSQTIACIIEHTARDAQSPPEPPPSEAPPVSGRLCCHEVSAGGIKTSCKERATQDGSFPAGWLCLRHYLEMIRRQQLP